MPHAPNPQLAILEHFSTLEDPRLVGRSDHPLVTILVIALVGVLCGANGWDEIHEIAEDRREWFARLLDMPKGVPSADTIRRVLSALRPNVFMGCITSWVRSFDAPALRRGGRARISLAVWNSGTGIRASVAVSEARTYNIAKQSLPGVWVRGRRGARARRAS